MTPYDAAMVAAVVAGLVWGAWKGITWQLASILSLVLGYSVAHPLSGQLASQFPGPPVAARALAMLTVYAVVSGGIFLVAWLIRATLRRWKFEAYDRHLGMLLGGLEGAMLGVVVTVFVVSLLTQSRQPIFTSPTGHMVCQMMNALGPVLPGEVRDELAPFWAAENPIAAEPPVPAAPVAETPREAPNPTDPNVSKAQGLIEEGESRIGRAVLQEAEKELGGGRDGGQSERR